MKGIVHPKMSQISLSPLRMRRPANVRDLAGAPVPPFGAEAS